MKQLLTFTGAFVLGNYVVDAIDASLLYFIFPAQNNDFLIEFIVRAINT